MVLNHTLHVPSHSSQRSLVSQLRTDFHSVATKVGRFKCIQEENNVNFPWLHDSTRPWNILVYRWSNTGNSLMWLSLLIQKPGRDGKMDYLICIYSNFSIIKQHMFYQSSMNVLIHHILPSIKFWLEFGFLYLNSFFCSIV